MLCAEPGVLQNSDYYFFTPSLFAKKLFYYPLCIGSYLCSPGYRVQRERYNSLLLMLILDGECTVEYGGGHFTAVAHDAVLLDCYQPHTYSTSTGLHMLWLHFDGGQSMEFARTICREKTVVFPCENFTTVQGLLENHLQSLRMGLSLSEPTVSLMIYNILCNLASTVDLTNSSGLAEDVSRQAIQYIRDNYRRQLFVREISRHISMSEAHFSRKFKKQTGYTPFEYILKTRLEQAKKLLKVTDLSVSQIAEETGFNSQSNFIYTFHRKEGLSPAQFRKMPF